MSVSPDELDAASLIADLVLENAQNYVQKKAEHLGVTVQTLYMQNLLAQHVKVQTTYLSCVKWKDGLDVAVTQHGALDVNAKLEFDNTTGGCFNVRAFQGE